MPRKWPFVDIEQYLETTFFTCPVCLKKNTKGKVVVCECDRCGFITCFDPCGVVKDLHYTCLNCFDEG